MLSFFSNTHFIMNKIVVKDKDLAKAAEEGMDAFLSVSSMPISMLWAAS